jgi:hypothetical protein
MSKLPEYPHFDTQTPALRDRIATAIAAIPAAHCLRPVKGEVFVDPQDAFVRLRDWGFTQGILLVKESANNKKGRWQIDCSRHHKETSNWRKTPAEERKRLDTKFQAHGCKCSLYISRQKKLNNQWAIGWTHETCNHKPLADPFVLDGLKMYEPNRQKARQLASTHRGILSYGDSTDILQKQGLKIGRKEYYNLIRKEETAPLTNQEELELVMATLEQNGFHPRPREEYIVEDGVRTKRLVRDIFFMSDDQIRLARRFVSGFLYETDATFSTNTRRLPLSVMVGIDNTGSTFPMAFMFITSEAAKSFEFASACLTDLCFHDCPQPSLICGDFSKGLGAAVAAQAAKDIAIAMMTDEDGFVDIDVFVDTEEEGSAGTKKFLDCETIVVEVAVGKKGEKTSLQLCEWHAIEAIKKRLINSGRYSKETREVLVDLLNRWVKSPDLEALENARKKLLSCLCSPERAYLRDFYQPKEPQFCRAYTRLLPNLGVHSTQRNESYHVVVKKRLHKNLTVSAACEAIVAKTKQLADEYNERINNNRKNRPSLMDKHAFKKVGAKLTHYAIDKTMAEWRATKDFADAIEGGDEDPFDFDEAIGCPCECELPLRFALPCKHWMLPFFLQNKPLSKSLFHPRWFLDGPAVVRSWKMSSPICIERVVESHSHRSVESISTNPSPTSSPYSYNSGSNTTLKHQALNRYQDDGAQMILDSTAKVVETLRSLPAGQKEGFASGFQQLTSKLRARTNEILASRQAMPAELPDPLPQPNVLFKSHRKRGYTGAEAAAENEKDARRAQRRAEIEAEARRKENAARSEDLRRTHTARHEEEETRRRESEYAAKFVERRRQQGFVAATPTTSASAPVPVPEEDAGALGFTGDMGHIGEPSRIGDYNLATSSSDELSDSPLTQVVSENETESSDSDDDEVLLSSHPPEASTSIQVPATAPTSTRSSMRSRKHTRKYESQHARDIATVEMKEQRRKEREAKANRTGTGRTKKAEALAQTSQLAMVDGIELPFRSSQ